MTPRRRRPGRIWWTWTFAVGVFSPGKGKRRINNKMQELYQDNRAQRESNSVLKSEIKFVRGELYRLQSEKSALLVQDEMTAAIHERSFVSPKGSDTETPRPLRWTTNRWPKVS